MEFEKKSPLVSIFIPYYNDREFLRNSITSALEQSYENIELVLLNHATTDDCRQIAHSFDDKRIVHIDYPENLGSGSGMLVSEFLKCARGEYIKLFCADDILKPDCIKDFVSFMQTNPNVDFAFSDMEYIDKRGEKLGTTWFNNRNGFSIDNDEIDCIRLYISGISFLPYSGSFAKRKIFENIELNKTFIMLFDMSLWLRLLIAGFKIGYLDKTEVFYRIHEDQLSSSNTKNYILANKRSFFEHQRFYEIFTEMKNPEMIKAVFADIPNVDKCQTEQDAPFILAKCLLEKGHPVGYCKMEKMLSDDKMREFIRKKYGFGIREFREIYSNVNSKKTIIKKANIYNTPPKELGLSSLLFLFGRRLFYILTLRDLHLIKRGGSKYSL